MACAVWGFLQPVAPQALMQAWQQRKFMALSKDLGVLPSAPGTERIL